MPAVAPEPGSADAAAVGGVAFEGGELRVGQGFARQGEQPEGGAGVFERVQGGRAIERDEPKIRRWKRVEWPAIKKKPAKRAEPSSSSTKAD